MISLSKDAKDATAGQGPASASLSQSSVPLPTRSQLCSPFSKWGAQQSLQPHRKVWGACEGGPGSHTALDWGADTQRPTRQFSGLGPSLFTGVETEPTSEVLGGWGREPSRTLS